jgi:hypothetical protein
MERQEIESLFEEFEKETIYPFPQAGEPLDVPSKQGVYVIRNPAGQVVHVGRTLRGRGGLSQRLNNHLRGQSSFVQTHLEGDASRLRDGYTYQYLEVPDDRKRALLECLAIASHCPQHLGVGALKPATH